MAPEVKMVKAPRDLVKKEPIDPGINGILKMDGMSVVESCSHINGKTGTMYLQDHLLLFVLEGNYTVRYGKQELTVRKNEMVMLQKAIVVEYEKHGDPGSDYTLDYMMFFLKDGLLNEFIRMANLKRAGAKDAVPVSVIPVNERLRSYVASLKPYFQKPEQIGDSLVKIKLLELLFDIVDADERLLYQFLQFRPKADLSIVEVVEENIMNPVSLNDLAYLSGRSLSTFKREFQAIYNTSTLQWIRNRRLEKARELLTHSAMTVTEVCFRTGFENVAHFSKVFKEKYGLPPSALKASAL